MEGGVGDYECPRTNPVVGEPFAIFTDVVITVKFIEKDDDLNPPFDGALIGTRSFEMEDMSIPVNIYAEMSTEPDIATPYGSNTYGFIVAMFNPRERIVTEEFAANIFSAPLRISGYHYNEATGERWLVADGGLVTFGNLKITPDDGFAMLWFNLDYGGQLPNIATGITTPLPHRDARLQRGDG